MVVGFTDRRHQYWQLQMAAHLAVQNKKQAITWERELFSKIAELITFGVQNPTHKLYFPKSIQMDAAYLNT